MFNKILKNPLEALANAAEINTLKDRREKLRNEKRDVDNKILRYTEQNGLVTSCATLLNAQSECIITLRTIFAENNIQYQLPVLEYNTLYTDPQLQQYKMLYDNLVMIETTLTPSIHCLRGNVSVDINAYRANSANLEKRIEECNEKLRKVRDKQFG
jgi:hypothetical protein